ncbi:MAG TPA: hypothetical protein VGI13_12710 [Candidatus Acidoferrum sp.]
MPAAIPGITGITGQRTGRIITTITQRTIQRNRARSNSPHRPSFDSVAPTPVRTLTSTYF